MEAGLFRFLRFSLGLEGEVKDLPDGRQGCFDWDACYQFAKRQTLVGVLFDGIQRLPKELAPARPLLLRWLSDSESIRRRNMRMDRASAYIYNKVCAAGFRCCILKGQGNALLYPHPSSRTPGDVDVWVMANREELRHIALSLTEGDGSSLQESLNHMGLTVHGVSVELHSTPVLLNSPLHNSRLQKWLKRNVDLQCSNVVELPDDAGEIAVPTQAFNVVYQLLHLYHHYFYEGIGLRQIVDYYFVVINDEALMIRDNLQGELKRLGLWKFAGAVMYVLHEVLGLPEERMIAPMDERRGKLLLAEILSGGNFGQYDERYGFGRSLFGHNMQRLCRDIRFVRFYPAEALSEPIFRAWHFFWRMKNKE
mgnify:CR=1 FL=1